MCQFLIGKVQRYTEQFLKLLIDQNVSIPHRQGTTRGRHEMPVSDFIFDEVSIPHRQGTTPENVQTTEATVIVSIPHRQGTTDMSWNKFSVNYNHVSIPHRQGTTKQKM